MRRRIVEFLFDCALVAFFGIALWEFNVFCDNADLVRATYSAAGAAGALYLFLKRGL